MDTPELLWIDLCCESPATGLLQCVPSKYAARRIHQLDRIPAAVLQHRPSLVCVEFDYPDGARLQAISTLRRMAPALPLLMFTEYHSEALAVWAFRSGVWDYRVKPVPGATLARMLETLLDRAGACTRERPAVPQVPPDLIEPAGHLHRPPSRSRRTGAVVAYIVRCFDREIRRDAMAKLCHLSASEFSRTFRREQDTTFERFLLQYRISRVRDFLVDPRMTVSGAAYAAGFNDVSYCSRVFRRLVGVTASEYQRRVRLLAPQATRADG